LKTATDPCRIFINLKGKPGGIDGELGGLILAQEFTAVLVGFHNLQANKCRAKVYLNRAIRRVIIISILLKTITPEIIQKINPESQFRFAVFHNSAIIRSDFTRPTGEAE
jgi:hypothetical protein